MVVADQKSPSPLIRRYLIRGSRTLSNYWWAVVTLFGGAGFLLTGLASYFQRSLFSEQTIAFFPQGLVMSFYGILGICLAFTFGLPSFGVSGVALTSSIGKRARFVFSVGVSPGKVAVLIYVIPSRMSRAFRLIFKRDSHQSGPSIYR